MAQRSERHFDVIVIGGGHAGVEAAWAASHMLAGWDAARRVALVTMDPGKIGAMSCNPAIGGLAKGQMVREIDALGGLMGLAADATGIQFKVLNASKGPAVRGPRCQSDKYAYAREVQRLLSTRPNLDIIAGSVEELLVEKGAVRGIVVKPSKHADGKTKTRSKPTVVNDRPQIERGGDATFGLDCCSEFGACENDQRFQATGDDTGTRDRPFKLHADAVVLTTGTFMRGLMHTGESKTEGGRVGEHAAVGISGALKQLGFELGRLKTGTPPRLAAETIDFTSLEVHPGDHEPQPFSDMTDTASFPRMKQVDCWVTHTDEAIHESIRANLDRAPMYNGQIETAGPRYCPSIEDKVVRFATKPSHHVFLEPESLETNEVYCNGISTSLPADVQDVIVRRLPGCENAKILRYGYAVEYDMVRPHQIDATTMTKRVDGLFLAGQINGTSGYEEAAGQGLLAGVNAVRFVDGESLVRLGRDQAYIGVLMDDLVTKTPVEPYRMFTSRAEHRLLLRADNADVRLTPLGRELGVVDDTRWSAYQARRQAAASLREHMRSTSLDGKRLIDLARQPTMTAEQLSEHLPEGWRIGSRGETNDDSAHARVADLALLRRELAELKYAGFIDRQRAAIERLARQEHQPLPTDVDYARVKGLRNEAVHALNRFRPTTVGQAGRLEGITPADVMLVLAALRSPLEEKPAASGS